VLIEQRNIDRIIPYAGNPREISSAAVDKVAASIREFGWRQPIVVDDDGVVIAGHTRLLAAQKLGLGSVPVHVAEGLTAAQVRALRLADNRTHEESSWNLELLSSELFALKELDFDLGLTAFDTPEIDRVLRLDAISDEQADAVPELPQVAVTRPGELWLCGPHRVLCGDATSAQDVTRLLDGARPLLMVTDPPYGVSYTPEWREAAGLGRQRQAGRVANDDQSGWTAAWRLFPGDVAYVWHAGVHAAEVSRGLCAADFEIRSQIIWAKQHFALSRGHYHWQHEPCWYAVRRGRSARWRGDRTQSTLWEVANLNCFGGDRAEVVTGHATQKPVELIRRALLNHSEPGELVYDPFLGSGTTLIAATLLERVCCGLELDPRYVDVLVRRWEQLLGESARLADCGTSFAEAEHLRQRKAA
jgi:DNA modification methylase